MTYRDQRGRFVKKTKDDIAIDKALGYLRRVAYIPDVEPPTKWLQEWGARRALEILEKAAS